MRPSKSVATRSIPVLTAIGQLRKDTGAYDQQILDALAACHAVADPLGAPVEVHFADLQPGMVLAEDVVSGRGILLLGRGTVVTAATLDRLTNHVQRDGISGSILVTRTSHESRRSPRTT
jgi:hypothetical protein